MMQAEALLVSFVVPTLNRGRYVLRAVESCLKAAAGAPGASVEVIVLDSQSDDGSWEALIKTYSHDPRVHLAQNKRGLGPTHSWIDGAKLARGQFMTFVWSDDYLSPHFLRDLLPSVRDGAELAIGQGCIRDIDDECDLPDGTGELRIAPYELIAAYFTPVDLKLPVSPTGALFSRRAFDAWLGLVEVWSKGSALRELVMWRRAIGPDLLLFLVAADLSTADIFVTRRAVAQFSSHTSSISISSSAWPLKVGYWLARMWVPCAAGNAPNGRRLTLAASALVQGMANSLTAPSQTLPSGESYRKALLQEVAELYRATRKEYGVAAIAKHSVGDASRRIWRALRAGASRG